MTWTISNKADRRGAELADGHYSRRTIGSPQFMPPGETLVLIHEEAVFGWWRPDPRSGIRAANGLDGWTCTIFRNIGTNLSSALILQAEKELIAYRSPSGMSCGPSGLLTYVWDSKVKSANPGYCFKKAGWHSANQCTECATFRKKTVDGKKTLLHKSFLLAGTAE